MKILLLLFFLPVMARSQQLSGSVYHKGLTDNPGRIVDHNLSDSAWQTISCKEKIEYCLNRAERFSQICSRFWSDSQPNYKKNIYRFNRMPAHYGENVFSERQRNFIKNNTDSIWHFLRNDLLAEKRHIHRWNYLLLIMKPDRRIIETVLDYWELREENSSEALSTIIRMMEQAHYTVYKSSGIYRDFGSYDRKAPQLQDPYVPYTTKNKDSLWAIIDEFCDSLLMSGPINRPLDVYQSLFSNITNHDSSYQKTRRLSAQRFKTLSAKELLAYCIYHPELYIQICFMPTDARRHPRKYIYEDYSFGTIEKSSYSKRQLEALRQKNDSCQPLLANLMRQEVFNEGLLQITNTWQAIPWLVQQHRWYGFRNSDYLAGLIQLLQQNHHARFAAYRFEKTTLKTRGQFFTETLIKKTPAAEKAILDFAMDLYHQKKKAIESKHYTFHLGLEPE
jgi:hypothetical protein